jgi:hypothetical protein
MFGMLDSVVQGRRDVDAREAAWLREVAEYDRSDGWRADGYLSCAAALRDRCRMSPGNARAAVELARKLTELPRVSEEFSRGDISAAHARAIATAFTPERVAALAPVERELAEAARTHTPQELGALVRYVTDAIDGDGGTASDAARHERRRLHMSRMLDGMPRPTVSTTSRPPRSTSPRSTPRWSAIGARTIRGARPSVVPTP